MAIIDSSLASANDFDAGAAVWAGQSHHDWLNLALWPIAICRPLTLSPFILDAAPYLSSEVHEMRNALR